MRKINRYLHLILKTKILFSSVKRKKYQMNYTFQTVSQTKSQHPVQSMQRKITEKIAIYSPLSQ